jgi:hypothetical protein
VKFDPKFKNLKKYFSNVIDFYEINCNDKNHGYLCSEAKIQHVPILRMTFPDVSSKKKSDQDLPTHQSAKEIINAIKGYMPNHLIKYKNSAKVKFTFILI